MSHLKESIKRVLPEEALRPYAWLLQHYRAIVDKREWQKVLHRTRHEHMVALSRLKGKSPIKCVFFALFESVWKYDRVYRLMERSDRFDPIVLVCPIVNYGKENMIDNMRRCFASLQKKGYNVICSYDEKTDRYLDVRQELNPDIIFYTSPYKGLIDDRYYIDQFEDVLTVYVPYFFSSNRDYQLSFNKPLHNLVWRRYLESDVHRKIARKCSYNKKNIVVSGFPGIDTFLDPNYRPNDVWKDKSARKKRIIWAPHHTIEPVGIIYYSCFLKYQDFMLSMAQKYSGSIEMIFKPHPLLRNKLNALWGEDKTNEYYARWRQGENTDYNDGEYVDLFLTSDAMIHDSASFTVEYLYVNKPVLRTLNGEDLTDQFNQFGLACLKNHYLAYDETEIEAFIQNVISGQDPMKESRTSFLKGTLIPHGSPSEFIIDDILDSIDSQRN